MKINKKNMNTIFNQIPIKPTLILLLVLSLAACTVCQNIETELLSTPATVKNLIPLEINYYLKGSKVKKISIDIENLGNYASLSLYADDNLLVDNLNVPQSGKQVLNTLVQFKQLGKVKFKLNVRDADIVINRISFEDVADLDIPFYKDISVKAGLDKVSSIKYGGPTIADIDQDGDYDFIVNNHNAESSKLYWNNGDGTVTKHDKNLSRWFMHDLHGTAMGDYDNDGDLDLVLTQGGGNGAHPSKANFYKNDNSNLVRFTGDVGIDRGGRGRGARWSDMDLDGDLDLLLVNETGLMKEKPQHFFYENMGDGTFKFKSVEGIQDVHQSRALITDINADNIDDIILYGPLSIWLGNGDFTFTEITEKALNYLPEFTQVMAVADIDIDNDGDLDLYLARGKVFEGGFGEPPSLDRDFQNKEIAIRTRGYEGIDEFEFMADGKIKLHDYYYLAQGIYRDKPYPIFLSENKKGNLVKSGEEFEMDSTLAIGWPDDLSINGLYFGYLGKNKWRAALVRHSDMFWSYKFSLSGVVDVMPKFEPHNRNEPDVLLRNDNGLFKDVSKEWNIQPGGNSLGVTIGDFNNDSHQDIFVYRWGFIGSRTSDYMLLNTGKGRFETVTMHGASDIGGPGHGDMGQAFDFDLDGDLDLLNGSENGEWYLYSNINPGAGNYILVKVGYAPKSNVDAISAEIIVKTAKNEYRKRVGSAGEVFSQSLLNIVHFGLGREEKIESIKVRWRNGETVLMKNISVNTIIDTDNVNPEKINIVQKNAEVRKGTSIELETSIEPINANKNIVWSSSDKTILKVNEKGIVSAVGNSGQSAIISVKSPMNNLSATSKVKIIDWFPMPIKSVELPVSSMEMLNSQSLKINATILPKYTDDQSLIWTSSNKQVAIVDNNGRVSALSPGETTIKTVSSVNKKISDELKLTVKPLIKPYAKILNKEKFEKLTVGDSITVNVEYHAGSGNTVISADEGGVRVWLRYFKNKWIPINDVILVDEKALKTESGKVTKSFSLADYTPTAELPEEQFYQLRVTFTSSDGNMYEDGLYPLNIVAED